MTRNLGTTFEVEGRPQNMATAKLWLASRFASPPAQETALPSGSPDYGPVTTGPTHGAAGAVLFENVAPGEYYLSVEPLGGGHIAWQYVFRPPETNAAGRLVAPAGGILHTDGSVQTSASVGSANALANAAGLTIAADTDASGTGDITFETAGVIRGRITHDGYGELPLRDRGGQRYNVRAMGLHAGGTPEDMADVIDIFDEIQADPAGIAYFPRGHYVFADGATAGGLKYQFPITRGNVVVEGDGGSTLLESTLSDANGRMFTIFGHGKTNGIANWATNEYYDATLYAISGAVVKGARTITLATPADAANFAVGDYVFIRTGQTLAALTGQPDAEINQIVSADAGTGVLTFRWPTTRPYAQEYYITGTSGITSTSVTANAAPFGVANVTDRTIENITLRGLHIKQRNGLQVLSPWQCVNVTIEGCILDYDYLGIGSQNSRIVRVRGNRFIHIASGSASYAVAPSTGCADWSIDDNDILSTTFSQIHLHEGVARTHVTRNRITANALTGNQLISIAARAYDLRIGGNIITVASGTDHVLFVAADAPDGGVIEPNTIVSPTASAGSINAKGWRVEPQDTVLPLSLRASQVAGGVASGSRWYSTWVKSSRTTGELGPIPFYGQVVTYYVNVTTAFDASATVTIGYDGNTAVYAAGADVTSTGIKVGAGGAKYRTSEESAARTIKAYVTGSPTVGEAEVLVEVLVGARRT
jgi:hypothetical protein